MAFEKNHQLSKGRPKGSKGKVNQQIKDAFKLLIENNLESLQKQCLTLHLTFTEIKYTVFDILFFQFY